MKSNKMMSSREDFLERYIDKYESRIARCYQADWDKYVEVCRLFLNESIVTGSVKTLLIDRIESVPADLEDKFTIKEKTEYSIWLFRSTVLCLNGRDVKIGDTVQHDLPVAFKFYINKNRSDRLINGGLPELYCIKDFNSIVELTTKELKKKLKPYGFDITYDTAESVTGDNKFEFFTIYLKQNRKYNKSEDLLINNKSIETLNKYYDQQISREDYYGSTYASASIFQSLINLGLKIGINKHEKFVDSFKKFVTENVSIEEINKLNQFRALYNKDIEILKKEYNTYFKTKNNVCDKAVPIFTESSNENIFENASKYVVNKNLFNKSFISYFNIGYSVPVEVYEEEDDYGMYIFTSDLIDNLNDISNKFVDKIPNRKLKNSGCVIKRCNNINDTSNGNIKTNEFNYEITYPKEISDLLLSIVERFKNIE